MKLLGHLGLKFEWHDDVPPGSTVIDPLPNPKRFGGITLPIINHEIVLDFGNSGWGIERK